MRKKYLIKLRKPTIKSIGLLPQSLLNLEEEQKKIKNVDMLTPHEVAQFHRLEAYKTGRGDIFRDWTDYQIYDRVLEYNAELSDRIIEPEATFGALTKYFFHQH